MTGPPRLTMLHGDRLVNVAGESHYQDALRAMTGPGEDVRQECTAVLVSEPENPHDHNAVAVRVEDRLVGYLPRAEAVEYRPLVVEIEERGRAAACGATIIGCTTLGVFLRLPPPR